MPCGGPRQRGPSIAELLAPEASSGLAKTTVPLVAGGARHGDSIRVDEMNTVSCGGTPGVSNAFASALWTVDALFAMARAGVDGVNLHTYSGATYELFTFKPVDGVWTASVKPQYYGMLLFAQAAPPRSRLLRVRGAGGPVRAWATRAPDHRTRVVLINDDPLHARVLTVRVPGRAGHRVARATAGPAPRRDRRRDARRPELRRRHHHRTARRHAAAHDGQPARRRLHACHSRRGAPRF